MSKIFIPLFAFLFFAKTLVAQVDTVPPVILCKQWLSLPVYPAGMTTAWVTDFVDTAYDNTTLNLEFGMRKACTGNGFPENQLSATFFVPELGEQVLELWVRDAVGNAASCLSNLSIISTANLDPMSTIHLARIGEEGIDSVTIKIQGSHCFFDSIDYQIPHNFSNWWSPISGWWLYYGAVTKSGYNLTVTPSKNINPLNGVTTNDLVLIQKHILGIKPFDSPWKRIAADANQDGEVTTSDIIVLRKLILGVTTELPSSKSWRFLPLDYTFPNPANPFLPPFPERIEVPNTADPAPSDFAFRGVKIGDVDFSADPNQ